DVDADHFEPGREMRSLVKPEVVIERVGMDEDQRRPVAGDLVPNIDTIGSAVGHGFRSSAPGKRSIAPAYAAAWWAWSWVPRGLYLSLEWQSDLPDLSGPA